MLRQPVDPEIQAGDGGGAIDEHIRGGETEPADLGADAERGHRTRSEMDDVDRSSGRSAPQQCGAGAFDHLDLLDAVERVRNAIGLIAVGEAVRIDLGVQPADREPVEEPIGGRAARVDAAHALGHIDQVGAALLRDSLGRHDLNAGRNVSDGGARLADRRSELKRRGIAETDRCRRGGRSRRRRRSRGWRTARLNPLRWLLLLRRGIDRYRFKIEGTLVFCRGRRGRRWMRRLAGRRLRRAALRGRRRLLGEGAGTRYDHNGQERGCTPSPAHSRGSSRPKAIGEPARRHRT
jgi:hypothetical protein